MITKNHQNPPSLREEALPLRRHAVHPGLALLRLAQALHSVHGKDSVDSKVENFDFKSFSRLLNRATAAAGWSFTGASRGSSRPFTWLEFTQELVRIFRFYFAFYCIIANYCKFSHLFEEFLFYPTSDSGAGLLSRQRDLLPSKTRGIYLPFPTYSELYFFHFPICRTVTKASASRTPTSSCRSSPWETTRGDKKNHQVAHWL